MPATMWTIKNASYIMLWIHTLFSRACTNYAVVFNIYIWIS